MLNRIYCKLKTIILDIRYLLGIGFNKKYASTKKLFLVGTPEYHNVGDIAIMEGEKQFIKNFFVQYTLFEITLEIYRRNKYIIRYIIKNGDALLITGGGFIGNIWNESNGMVIDILRRYKKNPVVIMPQTVFYSNNKNNASFEKDRYAYEDHKDVLFIIRETISYDYVKNNINFSGHSKCLLAPDMALFLNYPKSVVSREGVLLCLRHDKEKKINYSEYELIIATLKDVGYNNYTHTDTAYDKAVKREVRGLLLNKTFDKISKRELVVTDRLHGMLLSAITGTPCIVIEGTSHKTLGVYKWINNLPYIKIINNYDNLKKSILNIKSNVDGSNIDASLHNEFKLLAKEIKYFINKGCTI